MVIGLGAASRRVFIRVRARVRCGISRVIIKVRAGNRVRCGFLKGVY